MILKKVIELFKEPQENGKHLEIIKKRSSRNEKKINELFEKVNGGKINEAEKFSCGTKIRA
jgi:hypothetical protein